jgi:hypothetical protein
MSNEAWRGATTPDQREHRRLRVAQLTLQGLTQGAIAQELGVNVQTVAHDLEHVRGTWKRQRTQVVDELVAEEVERLHAMRAAIWERAQAGHLQSQLVALKISAAYRKLIGADAPDRIEVTQQVDITTHESFVALVAILQAELQDDPVRMNRIADQMEQLALSPSQGETMEDYLEQQDFQQEAERITAEVAHRRATCAPGHRPAPPPEYQTTEERRAAKHARTVARFELSTQRNVTSAMAELERLTGQDSSSGPNWADSEAEDPDDLDE